MRIDVTADDIANGEREMCGKCPVAIAIKRAAGLGAIAVLPFAVVIDNMPVINLPETAQQFINRFDKGQPVKPFSFEFALPDTAAITRAGAEAAHDQN